MPFRLLPEQMVQEHEVLARLSDALRTAIRWGQHGDLSRKLGAVHFLTESFQRHLERMLELEEHGGYLELVDQSHPELRSRGAAFRQQHQLFRSAVHGLLGWMNCNTAPTPSEVEAVFNDLTTLLETIDTHNKQELDLLREVILQQQPGAADPRD